MGVLTGELIFEAVRVVVMVGLLVAGVFIGGKLRAMTDARKAKKAAAAANEEA